jgi:hypothetical protein
MPTATSGRPAVTVQAVEIAQHVVIDRDIRVTAERVLRTHREGGGWAQKHHAYKRSTAKVSATMKWRRAPLA